VNARFDSITRYLSSTTEDIRTLELKEMTMLLLGITPSNKLKITVFLLNSKSQTASKRKLKKNSFQSFSEHKIRQHNHVLKKVEAMVLKKRKGKIKSS